MCGDPAPEATAYRHHLRALLKDGAAQSHQDLNGVLFVLRPTLAREEEARVYQVLYRVTEGFERLSLGPGGAAANTDATA